MSGFFNFEPIEGILRKKQKDGRLSHDTGDIKNAFPFNSSRKSNVFSEGINEIIGELVRLSNSLKEPNLKYEGDYYFSEYPLVNMVIEDVSFPEDMHQEVLTKFLEEYLYKNGSDLKPLHLYLFNYITSTENKGEKGKYARFIYDLLFYNKPEISSLFSKKDTDNLLTELIISSLPDLEANTGDHLNATKFSSISPDIKEMFACDFMFLSEHKDYFITHFFHLIHYYVFQYVLQFLRNAQRFGNAHSTEFMNPLHFTFDWETGVGSYRNAVLDFQFIKKNAKNLFVHIHTMSHLSHNTRNPNKDIQSYQKLVEELDRLNNEEQMMEKEKLINWIRTYSDLAYLTIPSDLHSDMSFSELFNTLFSQLHKGMSEGVYKKYGDNIEKLGKGKFLKARGKHGFVLSLKQEDFLLLSAVAVGKEKIPLKTYFKELERRGMTFDQYSKKEAVRLLEQQNYIEKKSDSGDAQYVKPIL
ncbi:DNA phosphorothioation-dependent restriction protein DptG [Bacillus sp. SB49]|uniref:DNA phosphorothioation-dependent restriction protein DptG n=1 Tax=Bacillus sp. SB49 TaxID=1071080 RepID=UPI0004115768|nr:DNA phosphorothioation-dependent restriction protein DptG [Bacillus sp. SB49]QHT48494.1 DNA phosphorothioation-dependent restriction protein DptG [Bacillus sp. SB49]